LLFKISFATQLDTHQFSVDVLPKEISDALIKEEKKKSKSKKK